jgi:Na+-driven multidrug efflux pump
MRPHSSNIYGSNRYHGKKDKTGLRFIMTIVFGVLFSIFGTWAVVEFILYLVKDNPFNWTSVWLTVAAMVLEIYFFIRVALSD